MADVAGAAAADGTPTAGIAAVVAEATLAATIPKSESTVDTGIPRLTAISDGLWPCRLSWLTCAGSESVTVSVGGGGAWVAAAGAEAAISAG